MPNTMGTGGRKSKLLSVGRVGIIGEGRSYSLSVGNVGIGRPDGAAGMSGAGGTGLSVVFQRCRGGGSPKTGGGISGRVGGAFVMYMLGC